MANRLIGKKIALLLEDGYDDQHVITSFNFFKEEGAVVRFVGSGRTTVFKSQNGTSLSADITAAEAKLTEYDAFIIPGGQAPENMRLFVTLISLITAADEHGKVIGSVGHGAQVLISAGAVKDRLVTCNPGIVIDVKNAGGLYANDPVVRDGNVICSRTGDDLPEFLDTIVDALSTTTTIQKNMFAGA